MMQTESSSSFLRTSAKLAKEAVEATGAGEIAAIKAARESPRASPRASPRGSPRGTPIVTPIVTPISTPRGHDRPTALTAPTTPTAHLVPVLSPLAGFIAEKSATGVLGFHTLATEEAVRSYHLPLLTDDLLLALQNGTVVGKLKAGFIRASYVHAYVRGQDALAVMYMLRGHAVKAMEVLDDSISVVNGMCTADEPCHVLQAICLPRLYSLRSCCFDSDDKADVNRSLIEAELWLSKAKDDDTARAIDQYRRCVRPYTPGLGDWHLPDTGEWVLMVVVALRLCGQGMWEGALEEFEGAMAELKEINDKTVLFQVRILHAWALFMIGDISMFHNKMRAIKQYTDHVEEPLTSDAAGELLSFRFSLSCFYDASEILVSKFKTANTFSFGHADVGEAKTAPSPAGSPQAFTVRTLSARNSLRSQKADSLHSSKGFSPRGSVVGNNRAEFTTMNIYHKITEAFLISRSRPKDMDVADMTDICIKISQRTPCHYLGGMYLFFCGMAAIAVYEHHLNVSCEGLVPTKAVDLAPFISAIEAEVSTFADLSKALNEVLVSLAQQSTKGRHPVLLYLYRALKVHACRMRGDIHEATKFSIIDPSCAAETVPLGVACLKMEIALCRLSAHDDAKSIPDKRENLSKAIASAKEAQVMFSVYEADIEIATLKRCIADCEDLVREMLPAFSGSRAGSSMTARAYWLDLSCDEDSDNEAEG
jgi:hypothetical protein